ncbi:phosphatidate phosphatase PAH1-like isoform X2 [Amaranthus tricolor]|uniref:phosphatidate phosphatase PAH1-like isoform X2 n=1 Tax=Amaranthus tricolor TaxID=29722 RepID=UPI0025881F53|nr:phosphatidate phosphatase PAH1-like isoform X2 [Amaranthus tricolor]
MNVVGKVGSLITQGVYSVATPFHPFGGAVDIIVVQQQDGSFRSTPWYVQFGKFQGVLKGAEKMVQIKVNGIEANFHMHLDNSGEAYFVREAVSIENGEEKQVLKDEREPTLEYSFSVDNSQCTINNENIENFRLQSTLSDPGILSENFSSFNRLERNDSDACRFYDFQDDQSFDDSMELSSEYGSNPYENMEVVENFVEAQGSDSEMVLVSVDGHILTAPISSSEHNGEIVQLDTPQFHLGPGKGNGFCEEDREFTVSETTWDSQYLNDLEASSIKPGSSENNNADLHQGFSNTVKIEEHTSENQESDGEHTQLSEVRHDEGTNKIYELESCEENKEFTHREAKPSVVCLNSRNSLCKNEESGEMSEHEAGGDEKILHEDGGVEDTHLPAGLDDEECPNRDEDDNCNKLQTIDSYIHSDIEDTSPSSKNEDKFRSCLDLTSAGVDETLESEVSTLQSQEEAESTEENSLQNTQSLLNKDDMQFPTEISGDGGSITNTNMGGVVDSSLSLVCENEKREHKDNTFTPTENASVCNEEPAALNPSVKIDISNESEDPKQHTGCSPERIETNLNPTIEISLCRHLLRPGMGLAAADEAFSAHRLSEDEFRSTASSLIKNENLIIRYNGKYLPWEQAAPIVLGMAVFGVHLPIESNDAIPVEQEVTSNVELPDSGSASGRRWRLWPIPFRRVKTLPRSTSNTSEEVFVDSESVSRSPSINLTPTSESGTPLSATSSKSPLKKIVRTNIPTNEQISSLNLKEGQNDVTFSFSTRVLGLQQVEAHIYLWKWNARIVISDVDGTITRSDVLGQFMPLVGKDWSQSGVARLFSAIKENGYQLLFLSARAIVQAYLTKSFLFNLKQDGKTLPNGPVVISPNGLFPSLYREVIRRAPHEFKIACLEDIKALFPPDYNPFYAGFGNRDTDELTYKKIGIPKGKIFIINPKGEVAINHRIDVKSYTSLHTLVNDMFPPTSMVEQEDYNAWNFWKMPLPDIDD